MNQNELMTKAMAMVAEGKTVEEALQFALSEAAKGTTKREGTRIAWMNTLTDMQELRKAIKSSNGMKSKMKANKDAVVRYTGEVKAGQQRVKDLMAEINKAPDPYAKAREFNAEPTEILTIWLNLQYKEVESLFEISRTTRKLSMDKAKEIRLVMDKTTPPAIEKALKTIGQDVYDAYEDRLKRGDQWLETINKTYRFCGIEG